MSQQLDINRQFCPYLDCTSGWCTSKFPKGVYCDFLARADEDGLHLEYLTKHEQDCIERAKEAHRSKASRDSDTNTPADRSAEGFREEVAGQASAGNDVQDVRTSVPTQRGEDRLMSTQAIQLILRSIREGKLDEYLQRLDKEIWERQRLLDEPRTEFKIGDYVEFKGDIAPRYLFGLSAKIVKVNPKTVKVRIPDEARYGRFAGARGLRVPKDLVMIRSIML